MTTKGCVVFDSDSHVVEPPALWEKYLEPEYRALGKHALWRPGMNWDAVGGLDPHTRHPMNEGRGTRRLASPTWMRWG